MTKKTKARYKIKVQIGKQPKEGKVYDFNTDNPTKALLSIKVEKLTEGIQIWMELDGKQSTYTANPFKAKRIFNDEATALSVIKSMHWILK